MEETNNAGREHFENICDDLLDKNVVKENRYQYMIQSFDSYKKAIALLGYFSQLRDFHTEYEQLTTKIFSHRKELLFRYKDLLTEEHNDIFKQLLISPTKTEFYTQGIHKYRKVKNYSTYYYRRKLYISMENETIDMVDMKRLIETIVSLDKYYDIYDETISFFMKTSDRFEQLMKKHFPDFIHL